jgi:hypothetical protein
MNTSYTGSQFVKEGFKHVYCIERQALGWSCSDPSRSDIHNYILPASYDADVMGEFIRRHPHFNVLHLHVKSHGKVKYPRFGVLSCVSVMQYILGVYWPFIFTPYALYNKIKNDPPKHIEVIAWHGIKYTQHKEKPSQQHSQQKWRAKN